MTRKLCSSVFFLYKEHVFPKADMKKYCHVKKKKDSTMTKIHKIDGNQEIIQAKITNLGSINLRKSINLHRKKITSAPSLMSNENLVPLSIRTKTPTMILAVTVILVINTSYIFISHYSCYRYLKISSVCTTTSKL